MVAAGDEQQLGCAVLAKQLSQADGPLAPGLLQFPKTPGLVSTKPSVQESLNEPPGSGGKVAVKVLSLSPLLPSVSATASAANAAAGEKEGEDSSKKKYKGELSKAEGALPAGLLVGSQNASLSPGGLQSGKAIIKRSPSSTMSPSETPSKPTTPFLSTTSLATSASLAPTAPDAAGTMETLLKQPARNKSRTKNNRRSSTSPHRGKHKSPDGGACIQDGQIATGFHQLFQQMAMAAHMPMLPLSMPPFPPTPLHFARPEYNMHDPDDKLAEQLLDELDSKDLLDLALLMQKKGYLADFVIDDMAFSRPSDTADTTDKMPQHPQSQHEQEQPCDDDSATNQDQALTECESGVTTLFVQNLPISFDQAATLEWLDGHGYRDLYDFVYCFGPKRDSRNSGSRALINFCDPEQASRFRTRFQNTSAEKISLVRIKISTAISQGFSENLKHVQAHAKKHGHQPYLAKAAAQAYWQSKAAPADEEQQGDVDWTATTVVIRNLPRRIHDQSGAMKLLNKHGHAGAYNFFLFLPAKQFHGSRQAASGDIGLAYAFVNFLTPGNAKDCLRTLHGKFLQGGEQALSVVASRIQGLEALQGRFAELARDGRHVPWVASGTAKPYQ
eukprot:TRINITY_DN72456_c0_g1_i1.p1 TRINITY_DN72456_c0_g1~~TRINITY_DN72456_c0_g1_i1.p1  ORF type:complete len:630 (-),score=142.42 TRINITY_DN72456_c0_g1_i1:225-2069(-)